MMRAALKNQLGYTLIELLFVIALLAVIAALAITTLRRRSEITRINKASLEVQQVLEAAMSFNVNEGDWPDNNSSFPNCDINNDKIKSFVEKYLPNQERRSGFGSYYCWDAASGGDKFWVAIQAPSDLIATRVAARLPNAITTTDPSVENNPPACNNASGDQSSDCYVKAEVSLPSLTNGKQNGLVQAGYCRSGSQLGSRQDGCKDITSNPDYFSYEIHGHCPTPNSQAYVVATPNFFLHQGSVYLQGIYSCRTGSNSNLPQCCSDPGSCGLSSASNQAPTICQLDGADPSKTSFVCQVNFQAILHTGHYGNSFVSKQKISGRTTLGNIGGSYLAYCVAGKKSLTLGQRY